MADRRLSNLPDITPSESGASASSPAPRHAASASVSKPASAAAGAHAAAHAAPATPKPSTSTRPAAVYTTPAAQTASIPEASTKGRKKAKKGRSTVWTIVFWVALAVFLVAAFLVGRTLWSYWHGSAQYEKLAEDVLEIPDELDAPPGDETPSFTLDDLKVDWNYLLGVNSQTVGWLYIPGTVINYPVVWCGNDTTYLTRTFDGKPGGNVTYGTLFLEGENNPDFSDPHNIIFGHAMKNGTMFGAILRMSWNGTFDECRDIYFLTPNGNLHLRTFAFVHVNATDVAVMTVRFKDDTAFASFIQNKINRSRFTPEGEIPAASEMGKIFSFITCDSAESTGRYILYAYVVESTIPGIEGIGGDSDGSGVTEELIEGLGQ